MLNELWEEEGNFFSGDSTRECIEQSIIKEYSSYSAGNVFSSKVVYNETMSHLSQKVLNSFNVTGSNWSLRRIISSNISMVCHINSQTSLRRLVKGRIERKPQMPPRALIQFVQLFELCYDRLQVNRNQNNKMYKILQGYAGACNGAARLEDALPQLTEDELQEVKQTAKQYGDLLSATEEKTETAPPVPMLAVVTPIKKKTVSASCVCQSLKTAPTVKSVLCLPHKQSDEPIQARSAHRDTQSHQASQSRISDSRHSTTVERSQRTDKEKDM